MAMLLVSLLTITFSDGIISFLIGLAGSLFASLLFLRYVLYYLRPRIEISPEIAADTDDEGCTWYWFKIINRSKYDGFDLTFKLEKRQWEPASGNCYHVNFEEVKLRKDSFAHITKFHSNEEVSIKKIAPHAFQVRTKEDLQSILKNKLLSLHLQVTVKHGLTGLSDSFEKSFSNLSCLKKGSFAFGNELIIEQFGN